MRVRGGGGLKFEKKNAGKVGHRFPSILCFFIHPQPNNIGPAWQQPRALFFNFSESGRVSGEGGGVGGTAIAY